MPTKKKLISIDDYIETFPKNVGEILENVRQIIRSAAPKASERISYGIPVFSMNNTYLIFFAGWKKHISIYPIPKNAGVLSKEISKYASGRGTIKFSLQEPIPYGLIKKIVTLLKREQK